MITTLNGLGYLKQAVLARRLAEDSDRAQTERMHIINYPESFIQECQHYMRATPELGELVKQARLAMVMAPGAPQKALRQLALQNEIMATRAAAGALGPLGTVMTSLALGLGNDSDEARRDFSYILQDPDGFARQRTQRMGGEYSSEIQAGVSQLSDILRLARAQPHESPTTYAPVLETVWRGLTPGHHWDPA